MDSDGYLFITGRLKEIINRGGEKISPREVDEVLLDHPAVTQAVTFAVPHATLGEDIAAAVVLCEKTTTERELRRFAATRLTDFKVPRRILIIEEMPINSTGKPERFALAEKLGLKVPDQGQHEGRADRISASTPVEKMLAQIWSQVLEIGRVGVHDNFFDLGGHSLLAAQVISRVLDAFQVELPLNSMFENPTVADLAERIETIRWARQAAQACTSSKVEKREEGEL
jgi:oxalate---CoA ligase